MARPDAGGQVSAAYLAQKRSAGYKESGGYHFCSSCVMTAEVRFAGVARLQCLQIGVADDPDADIKPGAHCRAWKGRR
jgi:hypothetical protein